VTQPRGQRRRRTKVGDPVLLLPPKTFESVTPSFVIRSPGWAVQRVYSPEPFDTQALTFRSFGPLNRFDHHRGDPATKRACEDPERAILYAGDGLVCCLGEFFADSHEIAVDGTMVAMLRAAREVVVLDLRGTRATGVGTTPALSAISQRRVTQAWARYLYEHPDLSGVDGLLYSASNSGDDALAFFERATGALDIAADLDLGDPRIAGELEIAADALHWSIAR